MSVPFRRAKPVSKNMSRSYDEANSDAETSSRSYERSTSSFAGVSKKPNRGSDEVTSSSDDPEEMTAQLADALRGNRAWQSRQVQMQRAPPALGQMPKSHHKKLTYRNQGTANVRNEGRVVVSQDTLLRWLESKAA